MKYGIKIIINKRKCNNIIDQIQLNDDDFDYMQFHKTLIVSHNHKKIQIIGVL